MFRGMEKKKCSYELPMQLGQYRLTEWIGKGGMGEIFLAYDPTCQRKVALKRILPKFALHETLRKRFLNEPRIAAQLTHPSIIPIYKLHEEKETIYYTMPYIEGKTLREILNKTRRAIDENLPIDPIGSSIQTLMIMFLNICNAIEYTHSKGFLHRDIKPENIIVGKFNEVVILDWGVATKIENIEREESECVEEEDLSSAKGLTKPGKTVGTVEFMAPEQALGAVSNVLTDIYALGATLYLILTLHFPFNRPSSLKKWRIQIEMEGVPLPTDPQEVAPYREITPKLAHIAVKCMHNDPDKRYKNVQELINEVQNYIQGFPEWVPLGNFHIDRPNEWKFQANVLLTKHMAISRYAGGREWVTLSLSKKSYSGNIQLNTKVKLRESSSGLGILMCAPEATPKKGIESGYLIWIGSKTQPGCQFLRSNIELIHLQQSYLAPEKYYTLSAEQQDNKFRFFVDNVLILSYISHIPLIGGHFGILFRDADFDMDPITLYSGSQNALVSCLAIPDALLMSKYYSTALTEYQRISHSFRGRSEGREAIFRAGFTLTEWGKHEKAHTQIYFGQAIKEFEKLRTTPGAPIEYVGKSLVYQAQNNLDAESKCLEQAIHLYPKHPLRYLLDEHIIIRLHESAHIDRTAAYTFTLLTIRYLPQIYARKEAQVLIKDLMTNWDPIPFIVVPSTPLEEESPHIRLSQQLAFWLARPKTLYELTLNIPKEGKQHFCLLENSLSALIALRATHIVEFILNVTYQKEGCPQFLRTKNIFEIILSSFSIERKLSLLIGETKPHILLSFIENVLTAQNAEKLLPYLSKNNTYELEYTWALLLTGKYGEVCKLLKNKPILEPSSPYYILWGCYLAGTKGREAAHSHFAPLTETTFPPIGTLLGHFLKGNIDLKSGWFKKAFVWEKLQLYRQLTLYHTCLGEHDRAVHYEKMVEKEVAHLYIPLDHIDL